MSNELKSVIVKCFQRIQEEFTANAAITPGHLVEVMSTNKVRVHATAEGAAERMFAIENELEGDGIDDAYAAADQVQVIIARPGDVINAILRDGETASIGSKLTSNGDGTLKVWAAHGESFEVGASSRAPGGLDLMEPESIIGVAVEAVDLSGSSGTVSSGLVGDQRIQVRII